MKVLQLTAHFKPNIGGVETHLTDLVNVLIKQGWIVTVLTYKPLTTRAEARVYERVHNLIIIRLPWLTGLFYKLIRYPILEFLYLLPGLFLTAPIVILKYNPEVIHAHGLVAGFVGVFWGKILSKKVIISTHSIYSFPKSGLYRRFVTLIFSNADYCLGLSKQACQELKTLGISERKIKVFTYWVDLNRFKKITGAKDKLQWNKDFVVLFVGRLVPEKGLDVLLASSKSWDKEIKLKIIGSGPLEEKVRKAAGLQNIDYIEGVDSVDLPIYYSGADLLIIPSTSEEGFGRVIIEALACGTPVLGSNRGAIPEAIDDTVGKLIDTNPENIRRVVSYFFRFKRKLKKLAGNCRNFAERRYSEKNAETIIDTYRS